MKDKGGSPRPLESIPHGPLTRHPLPLSPVLKSVQTPFLNELQLCLTGEAGEWRSGASSV